MINKLVLTAAGVLAMLATVPANALTLMNEDETAYEVSLIIGQGDAVTETFELEGGSARENFCEEGCIVRLSNGVEQSFEGNEIVTIKEGEFVVAE